MSEVFPKLQVRSPCLTGLLLTAAVSCSPVRDTLFVLEPPSAGQPAMPRPNAGGPAAGSAGSLQPQPMDAGMGNPAPPEADSGSPGPLGPPIDPNASFEWTATIPGAGACQPGRFMGTYTCMLDALLAPETFGGLLTLVLTGSSEAQLLTLSGQILVFDESGQPVGSADVTGGLDCNNQRLLAEIQPSQTMPLSLDRQIAWVNMAQPTMVGGFQGSLDPSTQTINGLLELVFQPAPRCSGSWQVRAVL